MAEETTALPQTWDELKQRDEYKDIPELALPHEFTVTQSALYAVCESYADKRLDRLSKMGVFDPAKGGRYDSEKATVLIAEMIDYINNFLRDLAKDQKAWDEWTKGRDPYTLFTLLLGVLRFIGSELGKSNASRVSTTTVR